MKKQIVIFLSLSLVFAFTSCDKGTKGSRTLLPNVSGAAGEVVVVLNGNLIQESLGQTYRDIFEEEYPMLPQSEPLFNLVLIPPTSFSDLFKNHRNIVITKVDSEFQKAQIITQRDVWAAPQTVLNVVGPNYPAIEKMLLEERERIVQLIEQAERDRVVQNALKYEFDDLRKRIEKKFAFSMNFPKGYKLKTDTTDFIWISYETPSTSQGIFIYEYPYTDNNTFTPQYLTEKRNEFLKKFVPGPSKGSYMITETIIPPAFTPLMFKGRYFGQLRGLWDVFAHPMGGPFISLTTIDEERQKVVTVEGYVYSPKHKKRNYLRQVEALLLTYTPYKNTSE
jgi:hypothetical protein